MTLKTSYKLRELRDILFATKPDDLLSKICRLPPDEGYPVKPLLVIIDDSVHMIEPSVISREQAQPYLQNRHHPRSGIARLKARYGDAWEPSLEHSTIRFYSVLTERELSFGEPLTSNSHYYIQETSEWRYCRRASEGLSALSLNEMQKKYLANHCQLSKAQKLHEWTPTQIQQMLKETSAYELLHMDWEKQSVCQWDMQEQFAHFLVDCCFVIHKNIHIAFTHRPPLIINFPEDQTQREHHLNQSHANIVKIFNVGLAGVSYSSETLISRINEKKIEYSQCLYVGLTQDNTRITSLPSLDNIIHIEPTEINQIFHSLERGLQVKRKEYEEQAYQVGTSASLRLTLFGTAHVHVDPEKAANPPPPYRKWTQL